MKVIENIELLKKLAPYLEDMETEYNYNYMSMWKTEYKYMLKKIPSNLHFVEPLKTLTTDELFTLMWKAICHFNMPYPNAWKLNWWTLIWDEEIKAKDLNEYFGKCVEYLIDNDLLWLWSQ